MFVSKVHKFSFQNLENSSEDKNGVDRHLVSKLKKVQF